MPSHVPPCARWPRKASGPFFAAPPTRLILPDPLPPRFTATLDARVRALFVHPILRGGRQLVEAPAEGAAPLALDVAVDTEAGTIRLTRFPELSDAVATAIGRVSASVRVVGEPEGAFADDGAVRIAVPLRLRTRHLLARGGDVELALSTDGALTEPELSAEGDAFDAGDPLAVLVGEGTFAGGSLKGGTLFLALHAEVQSVEVEGE